MDDLLVEIEKEHDIRVAEILQAAGVASKNKRDYAIPRDLSPEELARFLDPNPKKERKYRLKQGTKPYSKIIDAVARLTGLRKDDLQYRVFGQTNFRLTSAHEPENKFGELASRLGFRPSSPPA